MPTQVGIGLRNPHYQDILANKPPIDFLEVHCENYFAEGGKPLHYLEQISAHYPLSFHGVGLSLGTTDQLNAEHLKKLKSLINRFEPLFVSEHLCWGVIDGTYFNDLLPLPYTEESLQLFISNTQRVQEYLNRTIMIENISTYLEFEHSSLAEYEFLSELVKATGCQLLLDVNNLYVNSVNHQWNAKKYLQNLPAHAIKEIHLAGFTENIFEDGKLLIDTHDQLVSTEVWDLYEQAIHTIGPKPTLIEWDSHLPELNVLVQEAHKAKTVLKEYQHALFA